MKIILIFLFTAVLSFPQSKIIFTSVDYRNDDVRAAICESDGSQKTDLGFNRTYLPAWFGDNVLFNSDTYIWQCDTSGENLTQLMHGYRVSVSHDHTKFAFYNKGGIGIADTSGKIIQQVLVDPWEEVTITWSRDDSKVSYYDLKKEMCFFFNLAEEGVEEFGKFIYHPLSHKAHNKILFNRRGSDDLYDILIVGDNSDTIVVNDEGEMAVVPVWSSSGDYVAYLSIKEPTDTIDTDMLFADLVIYDARAAQKVTAAMNAGFTDQAFPQISFDAGDEFIYYTAITGLGTGALAKLNLKTFKIEIISGNPEIDERFPLVKDF
jgi:hypothetical protein